MIFCNLDHKRKTFKGYFSESVQFNFNFNIRNLFVKMSQKAAFFHCKYRKIRNTKINKRKKPTESSGFLSEHYGTKFEFFARRFKAFCRFF